MRFEYEYRERGDAGYILIKHSEYGVFASLSFRKTEDARAWLVRRKKEDEEYERRSGEGGCAEEGGHKEVGEMPAVEAQGPEEQGGRGEEESEARVK